MILASIAAIREHDIASLLANVPTHDHFAVALQADNRVSTTDVWCLDMCDNIL